MQYLHESCLYSLLVTSIITPQTYFPIEVNKDILHPERWSVTYEEKQARVCLYYSLLTTSSILLGRKPEFPPSVKWTPLMYPNCPTKLVGSGLASSPLSAESVVGYMLQTSSALVMIFSGTTNACLTEGDLDYHQTPISLHNSREEVLVHRGIYNIYNSVRSALLTMIGSQLRPGLELVISGHSLGGALAQLCALELAYYRPIVYTFGAPMIFNPIGGALFDVLVPQAYRVCNIADLVPISPLPIMPNGQVFVHAGQSILFQSNLGDYVANHSQAYMDRYHLPYRATTMYQEVNQVMKNKLK